MVRAALALLAAAAAAVAPHSSLAAPAIKDSNIGDVPAFLNNFSSTAEPVPTLPYPIAVYSQAAGLAQQTYCRDSAPGVVVGDSELLWTYGDGTSQQRVNIYNSSSLGLSLAYQGTNTSSVHSLVYDVDFIPVPGDKVLGLPFGSLVDQGFQNAFLSSWDVVQKQLVSYGINNSTRKVTVIGHSLGASQASLAAFAVEKAFGGGSVTRVVTFGQPRVGDIVYANYVDKVFAPTEATRRFSYVVSGQDFVPHVPTRAMGFQHPSGQVWINPANTTNWAYYPGQENIHGADTVLFPPLSFDDHEGVYMHTQIGASLGHCPATVGQD